MSQRNSNQEIVDVRNISTALIDIGVRTVKNNPKFFSGWAVGLLIFTLFSGFTPSPEQEHLFQVAARQAEPLSRQRGVAEDRMQRAYNRYYDSKGWFWSCDHVCQDNYREYQHRLAQFNEAADRERAAWTEAKSALGIFSTAGVGETRDLFWQRFGAGKNFAWRQTGWDAYFSAFYVAMNRDEGLGEYVMRLVFHALRNFTIGLFSAVVTFLWGLWSILLDYGTWWPIALLYFAGAALAVGSFALTWLIALYAGTAGTLFVGGLVLANTAQQRQQRLHDRQHYQYEPGAAPRHLRTD